MNNLVGFIHDRDKCQLEIIQMHETPSICIVALKQCSMWSSTNFMFAAIPRIQILFTNMTVLKMGAIWMVSGQEYMETAKQMSNEIQTPS